MSGLTPTPIAEFRRMLRDRGASMTALAAAVGVARNSLWRALREQSATDEVRRRIYACTTSGEWTALIQLEHWATWNSAQDAAELVAKPGVYVWLRMQECAHCHGDRRFVPCRKAVARETTHGICPACLRVHFPDFAAEVLANAAKQRTAA